MSEITSQTVQHLAGKSVVAGSVYDDLQRNPWKRGKLAPAVAGAARYASPCEKQLHLRLPTFSAMSTRGRIPCQESQRANRRLHEHQLIAQRCIPTVRSVRLMVPSTSIGQKTSGGRIPTLRPLRSSSAASASPAVPAATNVSAA